MRLEWKSTLWRRTGRIAAMLFAWTLMLTSAAGEHAAPARAGQKTGNHAAAVQMPLVDLAGYQRLVAKYRGKPLLVTFWATWCEPCETEFPMMVELAKKYAPQGLVTIGLNMDDDSDINVAHHFLERHKPGFPNYRQKPGIDLDAFYRGVNPEWNGAMPETIFYNRNGSIAGHFIGVQPLEMYEQGIRTILASPVATSRILGSPATPGGQ